jgi:amino acid transporter
MATNVDSEPIQSVGTLFQRRSSGLVRAASPIDTLIYNIMFTAPGLAIALLFLYQPAFYPGLNMYASLAIGVAFGLPTILIFAFLSAAIPRSGADYVWVSRILHPALAVMSSIGFTVLWLVFSGYQAQLFAKFGLAPLFRQIGLMTETPRLLRLSDWFYTDVGGFTSGAIATGLIVAVFVFFGLRGWFPIQNVWFAIAMLALVIVGVAGLVLSATDFREGINSALAWKTGSSNSYDAITSEASAAGFTVGPFDLRNTLIGMTWVYASFIFGISSTWIGGEIQRARRTQLWTVPAASLFTTAWAFLFIFAYDRMDQLDFVGGAGFLFGGTAFGSTPTFAELIGYALPLGLAIIVGIGFVLWPLVVVPNLLLNASRNVFAYSLDGLMPRWLSKINLRWGSPVINLIVILICSWIALALYQFTTLITTLSVGMVFTFSFIFVSLAAILFPYRRKDLFERSPVQWRVGSVPVICILGFLSLVYNAFFIWVFLNDPYSGIAGNSRMIATNVGIFFSGLVIYLIAKYYWRSRRYDLDANYKELPVE